MIATEGDKMRKCSTCVSRSVKSYVYPYRKSGDFNYEKDGTELHFEQRDVFWDEEGTPHSHVMYSCSRGHLFRGECESCSWGKEQEPIPATSVAAPVLTPPAPVLTPPAPAPVAPPAPPVLKPPVRDTSNDLVLGQQKVKK